MFTFLNSTLPISEYDSARGGIITLPLTQCTSVKRTVRLQLIDKNMKLKNI